ncbi:hypothetical protein [Haliangium sp. UPWRP_2]|uniref:hypothetical protein n=1 Tax=Haliangium sp. UPWRP_2 TaxID=1931276 RepID=UPI000B5425C8|nr:hypothetical protein [Haliangium sp. UPWRP_2]PSM31184.1 hypothetical protein BVG81_006710 [Haliangium sp. UPWRP_2]HNN95766.1 hypothetical protein [Pseudomonadota bacterium]
MRNLDLKLTVLPDRRAIVQLPEDFEPGETEVTLIVRKRPAAGRSSILDRLPSVDTGNWPADLTFSREQLYGDGDR